MRIAKMSLRLPQKFAKLKPPGQPPTNKDHRDCIYARKPAYFTSFPDTDTGQIRLDAGLDFNP
jgi:hypothetical protein